MVIGVSSPVVQPSITTGVVSITPELWMLISRATRAAARSVVPRWPASEAPATAAARLGNSCRSTFSSASVTSAGTPPVGVVTSHWNGLEHERTKTTRLSVPYSRRWPGEISSGYSHPMVAIPPAMLTVVCSKSLLKSSPTEYTTCTTGGWSSSTMVTLRDGGGTRVAPCTADTTKEKSSSSSPTASSRIGTLTTIEVSPAGMTAVPEVAVKSSPAIALPSEVA